MGLRLFPALISASSSELSPVGDIMLKDFVPADKRVEWKSGEKQSQNRTEKMRVRYMEDEGAREGLAGVSVLNISFDR